MARPRQVTDEQILETAREAFIEGGPSVSTAVIAERLGVSQAALFKRFGTKEALLVAALVPPERPSWVRMVEGGPDDRPLTTQLVEIGMAVSAFFEELVPRIMTLRSHGVCPHELYREHETPAPVSGKRAMAAWLERARGRGLIRDVDPETAAMLFLGSLHMRAFLHHIEGTPSDERPLEDQVTRLVDMLCRGLEPTEVP